MSQSTTKLSMDTGFKTLREYLHANRLTEVEVSKDGLCILHAVHGGLQSASAQGLSKETLKHMVLDEFLQNADEYMPYSALSAENTLAQLESWAQTGQYSSDSVDLILHILSQVLNVRILVVEENTSRATILELLPHRQDKCSLSPPMARVILIKHGQHFNHTVSSLAEEHSRFKKDRTCNGTTEPIIISSDSDDASCFPRKGPAFPIKVCKDEDVVLIRCFKRGRPHMSSYFQREDTLDAIFTMIDLDCFLETTNQSFTPGIKRTFRQLFGQRKVVNLNVVTYEDCLDPESCEASPVSQKHYPSGDTDGQESEVGSMAERESDLQQSSPVRLSQVDMPTRTSKDKQHGKGKSTVKLPRAQSLSHKNSATSDSDSMSSHRRKRRRFHTPDNSSEHSSSAAGQGHKGADQIHYSASPSISVHQSSSCPLDVEPSSVHQKGPSHSGLDDSLSPSGIRDLTHDDDNCIMVSSDDTADDVTGQFSYMCSEGPYWRGRKEVPVLELQNKIPYTMQKVCTLLVYDFEEEKCTDRPLCVRQDAAFLIDLNHVHRGDLVSDGNGVYSRELRHYRWIVKEVEGRWRHIQISEKLSDYVLNEGEYFLHWHTYAIPKYGLRRQINWMSDTDGNAVNNVAFLQYTLPSNVMSVNFVPQKHGNAKNSGLGKPFLGRLAQSTRNRISKGDSHQKPGLTLHNAEKNDPLCDDPCQHPTLKSIYNIRYNKKPRDPLQEILDFNEELNEDAIIGHHGTHGITLVFQTLYMRGNSKFIENGTVLQTDTTFGKQDFYVTTITLKDKSLINKDGEHPWVMVAVAFHEKKDSRVHELIVQDVVHATPAIRSKKYKVTIITDDEVALWRAWKPYGNLLRCCNHFQRNFKNYLGRDLRIPKENTADFLQALVGPEGLIDCEDEDEFEEKLRALKPDFENWEMIATGKTVGHPSRAYHWLKSRSKDIAKRILKSARRKANFPVHQRPYTNGAEGFNRRLQQVGKETSYCDKKMTFLEYFSSIILTIEKTMEASFTKAVIGQGDFKLTADYIYISVPAHVWVSLTQGEKKSYLKEAARLTPAEAKKRKVIAPLTEPNCIEVDETVDVTLPQSVQNALRDRGFSEPIVSLLIHGAEELLSSTSLITRKPGTGTVPEYLVYSKSKHGMNTCKINTSNVSCDCRGYRSKVTCKHSLAVAVQQKLLERHLGWLNNQPQTTNKTVLLSQRKPGTGNKGDKPKFRGRERSKKSGPLSKANADYNSTFSKCFHNNEPLVIIRKKDVRKDRYKCWHCNKPFENVVPPPPDNLVIAHRGAWEYPDKIDPTVKIISRRMTDYYYHVNRKCIRERYPYFLPEMLVISEGLALTRCQRDFLHKELNFTV